MDRQRNALASLRQPDERNALARAYDMGAEGLQNMADYYAPVMQFAQNPLGVSEEDMARRQAMMDYSRYGIDENSEYLGTPVVPMALPLSLSAIGRQGGVHNLNRLYTTSPRGEMLERIRETPYAVNRVRNWMDREFW